MQRRNQSDKVVLSLSVHGIAKDTIEVPSIGFTALNLSELSPPLFPFTKQEKESGTILSISDEAKMNLQEAELQDFTSNSQSLSDYWKELLAVSEAPKAIGGHELVVISSKARETILLNGEELVPFNTIYKETAEKEESSFEAKTDGIPAEALGSIPKDGKESANISVDGKASSAKQSNANDISEKIDEVEEISEEGAQFIELGPYERLPRLKNSFWHSGYTSALFSVPSAKSCRGSIQDSHQIEC